MAKKQRSHVDRSVPLDKREAFERQEARRRERQSGHDDDDFDTRLGDGFDMLDDDDHGDDIVSKFTNRLPWDD